MAGARRLRTGVAASTSAIFVNSFSFFANVGRMQFTPRQQLPRLRWRTAAAGLVLGLLLGFAGPFGSYPAFPRATRYAFWLGSTAAGMLAAVAAEAVLPRTRPRGGAVRIGAVALLSAVPMTFVVAWAMSLVQPGRVFTPQQLPGLFVAVAVVQLLVAYATAATEPLAAPAPDPAGMPDGPAAAVPAFPPALLDRLPPEIGSDILALETEDHYLRVHTPKGSALVLMRMADAVALLDPRLGAQVHRRWWVAEAAVVAVRRDGATMSLCLADWRVVPVGRTFAPTARTRFAHLAGRDPAGPGGATARAPRPPE
jgi:hypothetical protein